jgi:hypothetical protein
VWGKTAYSVAGRGECVCPDEETKFEGKEREERNIARDFVVEGR